jgi:hypothetical protein
MLDMNAQLGGEGLPGFTDGLGGLKYIFYLLCKSWGNVTSSSSSVQVTLWSKREYGLLQSLVASWILFALVFFLPRPCLNKQTIVASRLHASHLMIFVQPAFLPRRKPFIPTNYLVYHVVLYIDPRPSQANNSKL